MKEGDRSKLPKWVQDKLYLLEQRLAEAIADRDKVYNGVSGNKTTSVRVDGHMNRPHIYLSDHATIVFALCNGEEVSVGFNSGRTNIDHKTVYIRTNWQEACIIPSASNSFAVGTKESIYEPNK
jgi:hypothetical protein